MNIKNAKDFLYKVQKDKSLGEKEGQVKTKVNGRKNVLDLKILVCLDISGSISVDQFKQFIGQIDLIKGLSTIKVLETDVQVTALYDYVKTNDEVKVVRLSGGGGTEFKEAFSFAKKLNPDAILFMTDGFVGDSISDPGIPVGWVLTSDGEKPYNFGEVVLKLPSVI
jgi:predicted metal-dependent peptidase